MTDHITPQPPPRSPIASGGGKSSTERHGVDPVPVAERGTTGLDAAAQEFALHLACGESPDPVSFSARHPECDPSLLESRCREALGVRETLRVHAAGLGVGEGTFAPGRTVGDFRILTELGRGGMGVVLLAHQESLGRKVALKVLPLNPAVSSRALKRFRREALAIARLCHPGIVQVHAVGEEGETLFLVLEYVEGWSLARHLEHGLNEGEAVGWRLGSARERGYAGRAATLVAAVAEALDFAHARGIVHRDVKPANILIDQEGAPRLTDFGLAQDESDESISRTGDLAGTPYYMSPEQAMARVTVDSRSDIFSLGVVLYELLTRRRPFGGDTLPLILAEITTQEPLPIRKLNPSVPRDLAVICRHALEKAPGARYPTAGAMAKDLRRFLAHEAIEARPPTWRERAGRLLWRRRRTVLALAAIPLALLAWVGVKSLWFRPGWESQAATSMGRALDLEPLDGSSGEDVQGLVTAGIWAQMVLEQRAAGSPALVELAEQVLLRTDEEAHSLRTQGYAARTLSNDEGGIPDTIRRFRHRLRATRLLDGANALAPFSSIELRDTNEMILPLLSVTSSPPGGEVELVRLDPLTNGRVSSRIMGHAPIDRELIEPGLYRIVVRTADGMAEHTRWLRAGGKHYAEQVVVRPTADVLPGMIRVDVESDESFPVGTVHGPLPSQSYGSAPVSIPSFLIDEREVSCAEYRDYLLDTGGELPKCWPDPYDLRNDEYPVLCVTFREAQGYAEWAGKRLPTWFEWERAARGPEGFPYPEGHELDPNLVRAIDADVNWNDVTGKQDFSERVYAQLRLAGQTVGSPEGGRSPEGLLHVLDNVSEWTESPAIDVTPEGRRFPMERHWIMKGGSWARPRIRLDVVISAEAREDARWYGFRCAKSLEP